MDEAFLRESIVPMPLSDAEAGYIAAFLDGEGSIEASVRLKGGLRIVPRVTFVNSNKEVITWLATTIGADSQWKRQFPYGKKETRYNDSATDVYYLSLQGRGKLLALLKRIVPFMIVKRRQAELVLQFFALHRTRRRYSVEALEVALAIKEATGSKRQDHVASRENLKLLIKEMKGNVDTADAGPCG